VARPAFRKTEDAVYEVERLAKVGAGERDIAATLRVDRGTLRKYFSKEIAAARTAARIELLKRIRSRADMHLPSAQFMLRLLGGHKKQKPAPPAGAGQAAAKDEEDDKSE
jgi:hypothetical protein